MPDQVTLLLTDRETDLGRGVMRLQRCSQSASNATRSGGAIVVLFIMALAAQPRDLTSRPIGAGLLRQFGVGKYEVKDDGRVARNGRARAW